MLAQSPERAGRTHRKPQPATVVPNRLPGPSPITYDTGVNIGFFPDAVAGNLIRVIGNRFNSRLGGPLMVTNMATMVTLFPANSGVQSFTLAVAPNSMGTAMLIDFFQADLMANAFNAVTIPSTTVGADFLAVFLGAYGMSQPAGLLGMGDMTNLGQGFHAIGGGFYIAGNVTMAAAVPNRNAMLRVDGDFRIPVELMDFKIE